MQGQVACPPLPRAGGQQSKETHLKLHPPSLSLPPSLPLPSPPPVTGAVKDKLLPKGPATVTGAVKDKLLPRQSQATTANDSSQELVWSCLPFGIQRKQMDSSLKSLVGWFPLGVDCCMLIKDNEGEEGLRNCHEV